MVTSHDRPTCPDSQSCGPLLAPGQFEHSLLRQAQIHPAIRLPLDANVDPRSPLVQRLQRRTAFGNLTRLSSRPPGPGGSIIVLEFHDTSNRSAMLCVPAKAGSTSFFHWLYKRLAGHRWPVHPHSPPWVRVHARRTRAPMNKSCVTRALTVCAGSGCKFVAVAADSHRTTRAL